MVHSSFETLLDELIEYIWLKLPVKFVLRCKCVCKSWFILISDPRFAKLHFELGISSTNRLLLKFYGDDNHVNCIDIETPVHDDSAKVVFNFPDSPFAPYHKYRLYVVGSCRGFLLLATVYYGCMIYFVIWNPSTGFQKEFNLCQIVDKIVYEQYQYLCGFGYDPSINDYVVVIVTFSPLHTLKCFSLKTNSWCWTQSMVFYRPNHMDKSRVGQGSFLNGHLHWLVESYDNLYVIISVDLMKRNLSEIPLPNDLAAIGEKNKLNYLRVMGGCLCICVSGYRTLEAEVWMMKEYKVQSSWTKLPVFCANCSPPLFPICLNKNSEIFVCDGCEMLMKLDDKGKLLEHHANEGSKIYDVPNCVVYKESLLSLPGTWKN